MTTEQKQRTRALRQRGLDYGEIAAAIGIAKNTVKTYCWRNNLTVNGATEDAESEGIFETERVAACKNCGKTLVGLSKTKPRKFCCDACRFLWWRQNRDQRKRKSTAPTVCARCGAVFNSHGNKGRKYCSHPCYIAHRFMCEGAVAS